ncbi:MAG: ATP-dependent RecD-like DNA helicase [Lachnospiraceae bacterium]
MAELSGYVARVIFRNEENGYTVLAIEDENGEDYSVTGIFPAVSEGEYLTMTGEFVDHPTYGPQFQMQQFQFSVPSDRAGIERYLGSGAIKGIGAALAGRIVKKFGDDTFRVIEEEPEKLVSVKGISEKKAMEIAAQVAEKRDGRNAMIFLQQFGITMNLANRIYKKYNNDIYRILRENPYQLADDIEGVGFRIADEIAARAGIAHSSKFRIQSGIIYTLQQATYNGHTCLPLEELKQQASAILEVGQEEIQQELMDIIIGKKILVRAMVQDDGSEIQMVYISVFYYMELNSARMLMDLNIQDNMPLNLIEQRLERIQDKTGIVLDEKQKEAVYEAVNNGFLVVTGGPGTGKTTTINAMIHYFMDAGLEILLAAPTGRAAKRMTEATGFEAQTIHRLLEINGSPADGSNHFFQRNADNPLDADVIIIDEMSMVDINLLHALLQAIVVGTRLILVGDVDQLPSVGPGNVLKDIINSKCFHVVCLTQVFRQASESDIIVNAHKINRGERIVPNPHSKDFLFIPRNDAKVIGGAAVTLIRDKLPRYVQADQREIQVLTPMRKGVLGVDNLNLMLQQYLNPPSPDKKEINMGNVIFRTGDKVMQIKNNYQIEWEVVSRYGYAVEQGMGAFNGDMGIIKEINSFSEELKVEFDEGRIITYPFKTAAEELELAYAMTVHKSQGSEYPAVILPILTGPRMLMNRNILYTAVTRAKKCVCIVGDINTFQSMIANVQEQKRYSTLRQRLIELRAKNEE